ncbi:hypothetical protein RB597_000932 [Gaeumannomyces tritici]
MADNNEFDPDDLFAYSDEDDDEMGNAVADDNPLSNAQMKEGGGPEVYVPLCSDLKANYQVLKKLGEGKHFVVFSVWDINAQGKLAMKIPNEPLPRKGTGKGDRKEYNKKVKVLAKEVDNLLSIQTHISEGDGEISRHDKEDDVTMTAAEMGVAAGKPVTDMIIDQEVYGYMMHKSAKRNYRFTWMSKDARCNDGTQVSAAHFVMCNAGTMMTLRAMCVENKVRIPAEFGARCMAHLFKAWQSTVGSRQRGIFQNDYTEANVFLHSADSRQYPDCYLGDFGDGVAHEYASVRWRMEVLEYFRKLAGREVLQPQLEHARTLPRDDDRKLWLAIQSVMKKFLKELERKYKDGAAAELVGLVDATAKEFVGLEREAAQLEQSNVLKARFLEIVQRLKDPKCDILTFPTRAACVQATRDGGPLYGLPDNCRPIQLQEYGKLYWLDDSSEEDSDKV